MSSETNESLLPKIFVNNLEIDLSGPKISLNEFEIATGKSVSELGTLITEKLCSLPATRAMSIWNAMDETSKNDLTYHDYGAFNIELIDKLNIRGNELHFSFTKNLSRHFFELDNAPLSTSQYSHAFNTIHAELLSVCKQLYSSKPDGMQRLTNFLNSFEIDSLASVVRHEIARYYVDEQGTKLDLDIAESENGYEYIDNSKVENEHLVEGQEECLNHEPDLLEEPEDFDEREIGKNELLEFKTVFTEGYAIPSVLEFTYWLQNHAPEIFENIRILLLFFSKEQGINIWDRSNAAKPEAGTYETPELVFFSRSGNRGNIFASKVGGLICANDEKEERRLIRLYTIAHPLKNDFQKIYLQDFEKQGELIAKILKQSGKDTQGILTFGALRKAVWDAIGFTGVIQWTNRQDEPKRLIESSGKKQLVDELHVLGKGAFGDDAIIFDSLEITRRNVAKLFGWFCLVKIFWNIAGKRKQFINLASVKDDKLVWDENITVNTLLVQAVLNTENMFFSIDEVLSFCTAASENDWCKAMKQSFEDLAKSNDATSAIPVFHEKIENLKGLSRNVFLVSEQIHIGTKKERKLVEDVIQLVKEHFQDFNASISHRLKSEEEIKDAIILSFVFQLALIPNSEKYKKHALNLLDLEITKVSSFAEFSKLVEQDCKQFIDQDGKENTEEENIANPESGDVKSKGDFEDSKAFKKVLDIIKGTGLGDH